MTPEAWLTLLVVSGAVVAMAREWLEAPLALGGALGVLLLLGILTPEAALSGFANPAVATVALLLVLAAALEGSPWIGWLGARLFGSGGGRGGVSPRRALPPVAALSAFMANTPVVAVLIPGARAWAKRRGRSPSSILMPLSFAAILGGACTLVGTSANLVVHGMLLEEGDPGLGVFELARAGLPLALLGLFYLAVAGPRLLPVRADPLEEAGRNAREYTARLRVGPGSELVGAPVERLRHLRGLFLAGIERNGELLSPVGPAEPIRAGDVLLFVGLVETLAEVAAIPGVVAATEEPDPDGPEGSETGSAGGLGPASGQLVEAVVSPTSPLVGRRVREAGFRGRYDAVVLAVHRHGERVVAKVGDIALHPGDTLLLIAGPDFLARWRYSRDFLLVSEAGAVPARLRPGDWVEPAVLGAVVAVAALGLLPLLQATVAGVLALLLLRRLRGADVWRGLDWPTLLTVGAAIGVGHALVASGAAGAAAGALEAAVGRVAPWAAVALIFVAAGLLTELVTNVAAAALVFPVAMAAAEAGAAPAHAVAAAVALGASASFLTPFGYQTNAMVAGAAGYTLRDFWRLGLPLKLLYLGAGSILIPLAWGVW